VLTPTKELWFTFQKKNATVIYEDNTACIAQLKEGYIKGDRTKHISPKFFFTHDLKKVVKSAFNKFVRVIILQTSLQSHSQVEPLRNWYKGLVFVV
jgi:hypothetical protein